MAQTAHLSGTQGVNLGSANVGASGSTTAFTFSFDTGGMLGSTAVLTQGATGMDFTDAGGGSCAANTSYNSGATCTVNVKFSPKAAGIRKGAVVLKDSSGNVFATGYLYGVGVGPQVAFTPGTETAILNSGLSSPTGVAVDGAGNLYIQDSGNSRLIKATYSGGGYSISTIRDSIVGSGVAVDGAGNVYAADNNNSLVVKESPAGTGWIATQVTSGFVPGGIAVDVSGNLFIANRWEGDVMKETLAADGTYTESVAVSGLSTPMGVAVDQSGNLYISDLGAFAVYKETLTGSTYTQSTIPVSGQVQPSSMTIDGFGNLYFVDESTYQIDKETLTSGGYVPSVAVSGLTDSSGPFGLAVDSSGDLYIGYEGGNSVLKIVYSQPPTLTFASTSAGSTSTDSPQTVTVQNAGNAALVLSGLSYPVDFPEASGVSSDCTAASNLSSTSWCTLSINFTPDASGLSGATSNLSESVTLTDNNLNGTAVSQSVTVNGQATTNSATLTSPTPGSTMTGSSATFNWTAGVGVTYYSLWVGTQGVGSHDVAVIGATKALSGTVAGLPTNGQILYVRLLSYINGAWQYIDYTYTATGTPVLSTLISPTPGTKFSGTSATFTWSAGEAVTYYSLWIGTGVGTHDVALIPTTKSLTGTVSGLPTNGQILYVRLLSYINGAWQYIDYTYTANGSPVLSTLVSPTPGSTMTGTSATFTWSAGAAVTYYSLWVGTQGVGSHDVAVIGTTKALSGTVAGLPTNGQILYVRLLSYINGAWQYTDYTYTAF